MKKIVIEDYDPAWPELYEREATAIAAALGEHLVAIHHVGSTAVPGLAAKPVIDIQIGVTSLEAADRYCVPAMIDLGYEYVPEFEEQIPERRYFRKDNGLGLRTHNCHMVVPGSEWWIRHLAFRDYLRKHPEVRDAYAQLKRELSEFEYESVSDYADKKTEFIQSVEEKARSDDE